MMNYIYIDNNINNNNYIIYIDDYFDASDFMKSGGIDCQTDFFHTKKRRRRGFAPRQVGGKGSERIGPPRNPSDRPLSTRGQTCPSGFFCSPGRAGPTNTHPPRLGTQGTRGGGSQGPPGKAKKEKIVLFLKIFQPSVGTKEVRG